MYIQDLTKVRVHIQFQCYTTKFECHAMLEHPRTKRKLPFCSLQTLHYKSKITTSQSPARLHQRYVTACIKGLNLHKVTMDQYPCLCVPFESMVLP